MSRQVFVHVGASKTGTSALQRGLWNSAEPLLAAGVGLPFLGRQEHLRHLLQPLGWRPGSMYSEPMRPARLDLLVNRLRETPGERLLISNEDLAEAGPEQVAAFADLADRSDLEVQVVITARDWARQLPSEWQQFLKRRLTTDYPTFLAEVRERRGPDAAQFWARQDVTDVADRWGAGLDPARVHLILVPPRHVDADAVFRNFGAVIGYDPAVLKLPTRDVNASFGYVEAEVVRRINLALGDRLPDFTRDYLPAVRNTLVRHVLARRASSSIPLPPEHLDWVREAATRQVETVRERGYSVHGDATTLVPGPDATAPLPAVEEAAVADAAIRTLADFAVRVHRDAASRTTGS